MARYFVEFTRFQQGVVFDRKKLTISSGAILFSLRYSPPCNHSGTAERSGWAGSCFWSLDDRVWNRIAIRLLLVSADVLHIRCWGVEPNRFEIMEYLWINSLVSRAAIGENCGNSNLLGLRVR